MCVKELVARAKLIAGAAFFFLTSNCASMPIDGTKHHLTCRFVEASASEIAETIRVSV